MRAACEAGHDVGSSAIELPAIRPVSTFEMGRTHPWGKRSMHLFG